MSGHRLVTSSTTNTFFYGATKYAVTALTEGIRRELRGMNSDVKVTVSSLAVDMTCNLNVVIFQSISPGLVRTEFSGRLRKVEDIEQSKKDYSDWVSDPCASLLSEEMTMKSTL